MLGPSGSQPGAAVPVVAVGGAGVIDDVIARSTAVARARTLLVGARGELDDAVSCLASGVNEKVMASSKVLDLLFRVVAARRHLEDLERRPDEAGPGPRGLMRPPALP